jgi:FkbM family methyltransferase
LLTSRFRHKLQTSPRRAVVAASTALPSTLVERVRREYAGTSTDSVKGRLLSGFLEIVRHRGIPQEIHTFELIDNPGVRFVSGDSLALQRLYWFGERGHEPAVMRCWRSCCRAATKILELGGNVGSFTVQGGLAAPVTEYTVVEPHPLSAQLLRQNLDVNNLHHVKVIEAAATGEQSQDHVELWIPAKDHFGAPGGAYLPTGSEIARSPRESITVSAVDVRNLIEGVDLLKLDVEGFEYALLSSIRDYLLDRTPTIFVEVLARARRLQAFIGELCLGPYLCFVPTDEGVVEVQPTEMGVEAMRKLGSRDVVLAIDVSHLLSQ